jgi:hypothetical protein
MRSRGLTVPPEEGALATHVRCHLKTGVSPDANADADAGSDHSISPVSATSAHAALLNLCRLSAGDDLEPDGCFANDSEVDELAAACRAAATAADAYRTMASEALSLPVAFSAVSCARNPNAESVLEAELPLARRAQAEIKTVVDRVSRIRTSYSAIARATSKSDAARAHASLALRSATAERLEASAVTLGNCFVQTEPVTAVGPRAPRVPTREA